MSITSYVAKVENLARRHKKATVVIAGAVVFAAAYLHYTRKEKTSWFLTGGGVGGNGGAGGFRTGIQSTSMYDPRFHYDVHGSAEGSGYPQCEAPYPWQ